MKMQVGRWGNSLAVRLPKAMTDKFAIAEGDEIDSAGLEAALAAAMDEERELRRSEALKRMGEAKWTLPSDWKFDREEANWRPAMDRW